MKLQKIWLPCVAGMWVGITPMAYALDSITVYEFYHAGLDHYFRTADTGEAAAIDNGAAGQGWSRTGDDFLAYSATATSGNAVPVCRFYGSMSPGPNSHFYTASQEECDSLKALQLITPDSEKRWNYEGLAFAIALPATGVCPSGYTSIYRLYNNGFSRGEDSNHRYTSLTGEYQRLQSAGWDGEGVVMCSPSSSSLSPPVNVAVTNAGSQTVGSSTFSSSTQLVVSWAAPTDYTVDHYAISASETVGNTSLSYSAAASGTSATLTGLKSGTSYSVVVSACKDAACAEAGSAAAVSGTTSEEYWQIQGTGNTWNTAMEVISDSNTKAWAFVYGPGAGGGLDGTAKLFYDPDFSDPAQKGVKIGYTTSAATINPSSVSSFAPATGYGLRYKGSNNYELATSQPVPLSSAMGSKIRLFFEFSYIGPGNKVGIYYLDSQDGYTGLDYNRGSATVCSTDAEFAVGGDCAPTLAVGSSSQEFTGIDSARQFKIGYPILNDWSWDGDAGTFMLFSMNTAAGACASDISGVGHAQWNGSAWTISNTAGCPKYWKNMQAPVPIHLGGVRYKMYYGNTNPDDATCTASSPVPGTKKVLYADGAISGNATTVEYEDWETMASQRDITFLWPDGTEVDSCSEKKMDDFVVYMPTLSTDFQVMYMVNENLWVAMAVLLNP
ncbi:MAG: fibronectin type III domain-containing protein [Gallionella sp.]|nr:fibronectin type III domain-containing protein [Gallionella sp.]